MQEHLNAILLQHDVNLETKASALGENVTTYLNETVLTLEPQHQRYSLLKAITSCVLSRQGNESWEQYPKAPLPGPTPASVSTLRCEADLASP